jgi:hypothetical protein
MSWRTAAAVLIVVFSITLTMAVVAGPLKDFQQGINESGDYSNDHFDGEQTIQDTISSFFDMGLVAVFGIMAWGIARVVRRELTRGRR